MSPCTDLGPWRRERWECVEWGAAEGGSANPASERLVAEHPAQVIAVGGITLSMAANQSLTVLKIEGVTSLTDGDKAIA